MALSERNRKRNSVAAAKALPAGTPINECVLGRGHFRFTTGAVVVTAVFGVAFVVALLFGLVIFPGLLVIFYVFAEVRPARSVVVTDRNLVVLGHGTWIARPKHVLESLPLARVYASVSKGITVLAFGSEQISLPRPEFDRLDRAIAAIIQSGYSAPNGFGSPPFGQPPSGSTPWELPASPPTDPRQF